MWEWIFIVAHFTSSDSLPDFSFMYWFVVQQKHRMIFMRLELWIMPGYDLKWDHVRCASCCCNRVTYNVIHIAIQTPLGNFPQWLSIMFFIRLDENPVQWTLIRLQDSIMIDAMWEYMARDRPVKPKTDHSTYDRILTPRSINYPLEMYTGVNSVLYEIETMVWCRRSYMCYCMSALAQDYAHRAHFGRWKTCIEHMIGTDYHLVPIAAPIASNGLTMWTVKLNSI